MAHICFLSGLEIPAGRFSRDHWYPRSLIPKNFYSIKQNIFPAHKAINMIKGNVIPCEWEEKKFELVYHAIHHYNLKNADKEFCRKALKNWETYIIDPCVWCIMQQKCQGKQR